MNRSVVVALLMSAAVGSLLNVINHGYALLNPAEDVNWLQFGLNYVVPFSVSLGSSKLTRRAGGG